MKKEVVFRVLKSDASEMEYFGRVVLEEGVITFEGLTPHFIKEMADSGVIANAQQGPVFPKDGEKFLNALPIEFSGSALRASAVREVK